MIQPFANLHRLMWLSLIGLSGAAWAQVDRGTSSPNPQKPAVIFSQNDLAPWLGFEVTRADEAVRAQLPKLPKGVGFIITSIAPQSPARVAGLKSYDVLWMWNDQWLVNEAQLSTLLEMQKAGDRVELTIFRGGEEKKLFVTLGKEPDPRAVAAGPTLESTKTPTIVPELSTLRSLDVNSRIAKLEDGSGVLEMELRADGTWLIITNQAGTTVFDGLFQEQEINAIPAVWHDRVAALHRTLHGRMTRKSPSEKTHRLHSPVTEMQSTIPVSSPRR
jgi:uncharacterized protein (DUF58 family)